MRVMSPGLQISRNLRLFNTFLKPAGVALRWCFAHMVTQKGATPLSPKVLTERSSSHQ